MSTRDRVKRHRQRLRDQGMRPIQIWVPDTRAPSFANEAHRQSLLAANDPDTADAQEFIESTSDWDDE
ncbi:hypothetical protein ASG90_00640 [Nocardioides sp. Soil797]|nr:hypothetical protein ASG90_00640 [Nocardioides sp. Soil797]